jgi:hypothetical protein
MKYQCCLYSGRTKFRYNSETNICEVVNIFTQYVGLHMSKYRVVRRKLEVNAVAASKTNV